MFSLDRLKYSASTQDFRKLDSWMQREINLKIHLIYTVSVPKPTQFCKRASWKANIFILFIWIDFWAKLTIPYKKYLQILQDSDNYFWHWVYLSTAMQLRDTVVVWRCEMRLVRWKDHPEKFIAAAKIGVPLTHSTFTIFRISWHGNLHLIMCHGF
jgi:hypothetical protein